MSRPTKAQHTPRLFRDGEQVTMIVLPNIQAMMCGVSVIYKAHPRYRLNYTDGQFEEAVCETMPDDAGVFHIVSAVQETARRVR